MWRRRRRCCRPRARRPRTPQLAAAHRGTTDFYYLDVSWDETLRRHATRPQSAEFGPEHMRSWYQHHDLLGLSDEHLIHEASALDHTTNQMLGRTFARLPAPADRGPTRR